MAAPYVPGIAPESAEQSDKAKAEALRRALRAGVLGLGSGTALAAALGLPQLLRRPNVPTYPLQTEVELSYPQPVKGASLLTDTAIGAPIGLGALGAYRGHRDAEEPGHGLAHGAIEGVGQGLAAIPGALAGAGLGDLLVRSQASRTGRVAGAVKSRVPKWLGGRPVASLILQALGGGATVALGRPAAGQVADKLVGKPEKKADWADSAVKAVMPTPVGSPVPTVGSPHWMRGDSHSTPSSIPWAVPLAGAAAAGGAVGGHQLVQYLLRKKRKAALKQELDDAQKEYETAMLAQYDPTKLRTLSEAKEAAAAPTALDVCYDALEKQGDLNAALGVGAGAYGLGAGALATLAGLGTYHWQKSRSGQKLLRDALKRRATLRSLQNPPDMYIRPVPVEYVEQPSEPKA